jgi:hypothetical protein
VWFDDFLEAIKGILPMWAEAYEVNKDPQVEDNTLDYRTVANDLRRVAGKQKNTSKIAKGSFGPTFADDSSEDATNRIKKVSQRRLEHASDRRIKDNHAYDNSDKSIKDRRVHNASDKSIKDHRGYKTSDKSIKDNHDYERLHSSKKRRHTSDKSIKVCSACEGPHLTRLCYYIFPKKAPEGWTPHPFIQKLVERNLKDDSTLGEEVKRWAKTRQGDKEGSDD